MAYQELELKFVVGQRASTMWSSHLQETLEKAGFTVSEGPAKTLINTYYDTPDMWFEQRKMGMRVRGVDGQFEQTLKMQTAVQSGMHERKEFNIPLPSEHVDLALFPTQAWPESMDIEPSSMRLKPQFTTHFTRKTIVLECSDGQCEMVFDEGTIETENNTQLLNEVEIELLEGDAAILLQAARCLPLTSMRLSDASKAAQGYALLNGELGKLRPLPTCLPLQPQESTENVFCMSCEAAMAHWQHHEHLFFSSQRPKMLPEIATSIRALLQSLAVFLPVLQCEPMLKLQRNVLNFSEKWLWMDELTSTRFLLSRKGPFFKTLSRQTAVTSYLQGRKAGLLNAHEPDVLLMSEEANRIKLDVIELLLKKPWRKKAVGYDLPVIEHARGWLSQGWQTLHQAMQSSRPLLSTNYTAVETLMRQTLFNGFMLSDLFPESGPVRAPWLDLLVGIDEIRALLLLKQALREADLDYEDGFEIWIDEKLVHLLQVMERTRQVAMTRHMYW